MRASDPARVLCESDYHAWAELAPRTTAAIEAYGKARDMDINDELITQLADNFLRYYHYADTMA